MAVTVKQARRRLPALIAEVNDNQAAVEIIAGGQSAFLVPADEYRSFRGPGYLLQSPKNAERLEASVADVRASGVERQETRAAAEVITRTTERVTKPPCDKFFSTKDWRTSFHFLRRPWIVKHRV